MNVVAVDLHAPSESPPSIAIAADAVFRVLGEEKKSIVFRTVSFWGEQLGPSRPGLFQTT